MSDSSLTLLAVNLGDGDIEIGPFELFGATDESVPDIESEPAANGNEPRDDAADAELGCGCRARSVAGLLLALVALVAIGVATLRGDDEVPSGIAGDD